MRKWLLAGVLVVIGLPGAIYAVGLCLPREHTATSRATFSQSPETIWAVITDHADAPNWRPDISTVEPGEDQNGHPVWIETSRFGPLPLEVEKVEKPHLYQLRIADPDLPFGGTWTYSLLATENGCTLAITESGEIDLPPFRVMTFFTGYHGTLDLYLKNLGRKFAEDVTPEHVE